MSVINLGRTFKQSIAFYQIDGMGRDCYITYNNGGLVKTFEPLAKQKLIKFLRKNEEEYMIKHKLFLTRSQREYIHKIKKLI